MSELLAVAAIYPLAVRLLRWRIRKAKDRQRVTAIVESTGDAIFCVKLDGKIISWNPAAQRMFGYSEEEAVGRDLAMLVPPELPGEVDLLLQELREPEAAVNRLSKRLTRDGRRIDVSITTSPLRDTDGRVIGVSKILRDAGHFHRTAAELQRAKEEAEAANRAKSAFLATMSHEIRTPMTAIIGYTELLRSPGVGEMDRQNWTRTVETSARRLLDILNDVLDLSKIEAGQMELRRQPCAPRQIVDEVIALFRPQAMAKNITLKGVISAELPGLIETDGPRVRQILINLVGNAIKFTAQGGVELVARVAHLADGERIYFDVSDTGPGISADQQARLFKPFAQGGNPGSRRQSGTGLGLAISSSLARMLGGDVTVLSEPGRGSTFTASIASCRVAAPIMDQSPAKLSFNSKLIGSVLIADDSGPIRRLLRNYLVGAGIGVMCARNGREAVEHVEYASAGGCPFDLVLMDLQMPEMDGFEAVRAMRDRGHAVPVIAITAAILQNSRSDCIAAGFDDLLNKPFDRERLLAVIGRYLGKQSDNATAEQPPACAA